MTLPRKKITVLVLEDEPLVSLDICDIIVQAGYDVVGPAHTVSGALSLLRQNTPQVAIVDLFLKDGASTEVLRQLRQQHIPFLVHTGYLQDGAESDCQDAPWLGKPAAPDHLLAALGTICEAELVQ